MLGGGWLALARAPNDSPPLGAISNGTPIAKNTSSCRGKEGKEVVVDGTWPTV